jgi:hypothetical protein
MNRWASLVALLSAPACVARNESAAAAQAREAMARAEASGERRGNLTLVCEPDDAVVVLDGVQQGLCRDFAGQPTSLVVGDGLHRIEVTKPGHWPYETMYQPGGAKAVLRIELKKIPSPVEGEG